MKNIVILSGVPVLEQSSVRGFTPRSEGSLTYVRICLAMLLMFLVMSRDAQATSHCTAASRGITTFSCDGTPTGFVCGNAPDYTCYTGASEPPLGANQNFSCSSCDAVCNTGFADCNAGAGCETAILSGACDAGAGPGSGTYTGASCSRVCTVNPRPAVTLAPFAVQADDQANPSLWINKTGGGLMARLVGAGTDRVVVTNVGQLVLGLSSTDWTTFTQTVGVGQNLIYGGITAASAGNVFLFQRQGTPNLTLLQLDASGNLNVGAQVRAPEVCIAGVCRTSWPTGGIATSGTPTAGTIARFTGTPLTLTNSLISESATAVAINGTLTIGTGGPVLTGSPTGLSVGGNITGTGCFGPTFVGVTGTITNGNIISGTLTGYRAAHNFCAAAFTGSHMCTIQEILNSVSCGASAGTSAVFTATGRAWISNGAPALPTQTNDCTGWTYGLASATVNGVAWEFNANGGTGWAQICDSNYALACCR